MVGMRIIGPLVVAAAAVGTLLIARGLIQLAGGEAGPTEPLPPQEENTPGIPAGGPNSVVINVEDVQEAAFDLFIFSVRYSNLATEEQTFDALMQIKQPNGEVVVLKAERITIDARSSRVVRFSSGNLFKFATVRGIWNAEFFAWESFENPVLFSDTVISEFIVDVL